MAETRNGTTNGANNHADLDVDVLIVGAGFSGTYLLHLLRKSNLKTKLIEAGTGLGGVWHWNRYPGARVDSEAPYYSYSDPAIWKEFHWTQRYPGQDELREYFNHVDRVWDISKDVLYNNKVTSAVFGEDERWTVKTSSGKVCRSTFFIAATGSVVKQHMPEWEGIDKFQGKLYHSAAWPREGVNLKGKRVAVIGSGASALQIVQAASKDASYLVELVRTPNIALPMVQRDVNSAEEIAHRGYMKYVYPALRNTYSGNPGDADLRRTMDVPAAEREAVWEELWKRGGFYLITENFFDIFSEPEGNLAFYDFWKRKTRARISDPKKRDILAPEKAPHYFCTKRPSLEYDYYESCDQPHVDITSSPILSFTPTGIRTADGDHNVDIVAVATGYDAVTGALLNMGIHGRDGVALTEKWRGGVHTHLGMTVHGFPNLFMAYGPQAPTAFTNGPPFLEMQCEWIRDAICAVRERGAHCLQPMQDAERGWREETLALGDMTLVPQTKGWYMGDNIPGKPRELLFYVGGLPAWWARCTKAIDGLQDFEVW